jgi:hypothetical protein
MFDGVIIKNKNDKDNFENNYNKKKQEKKSCRETL